LAAGYPLKQELPFGHFPPKSNPASLSRRQPNHPFRTCGFAPLPSGRFALFASIFFFQLRLATGRSLLGFPGDAA